MHRHRPMRLVAEPIRSIVAYQEHRMGRAGVRTAAALWREAVLDGVPGGPVPDQRSCASRDRLFARRSRGSSPSASRNWGEGDVARLLADPLHRAHRGKIEATIGNARDLARPRRGRGLGREDVGLRRWRAAAERLALDG